MEHWICVTCGAQFEASQQPPLNCPICMDERQYIGHQGQQWTTLATLHQEGYHNKLMEHETGLLGIGIEPGFAIGQRALLVQTPQGNILWDCIPLFDEATAKEVRQRGGIRAIAISHPHYYTGMVEWAEHFDAPIYLHEADRQWVLRSSDRITYWSGETLSLQEEITLIRLGGHFAGGTVLHWAQAADGKGVLLSGDIIQVVADRRWVSFLYSYPNLIPLPASEVKRMVQTISTYPFERLYGAWFERYVEGGNAYEAVQRSAQRYIQAVEHPFTIYTHRPGSN